MLHILKVTVDGIDRRFGQPGAVILALELFFLGAVGQISQFHQNRRNILRFQDGKSGNTMGILQRVGRFAHFRGNECRQFGGAVHGFALGQIEQNIGNLF